MTLRLRLIVPITLAAGLMMSACTESEPTPAEAGQVLKRHIDQTMKNAFAVDVEITDPGGKDVPCGSDRYRRTYAVKAKAGVGSGNPEMVTLALIGGLHEVARYELHDVGTDLTKREAVSRQYHTRMLISSPSKGNMVIEGETDCLPLQ
ncbi:hypothetical protein [Microbispora bryophytorum]|uniref:Lipoprotein n=1 Tax=Microbispora bryophytorum TaxID=1460882 RepID=A0A8H9LJG0_9ACTN|nr:hypothetical protein [Microbispora bryophytorum]MBD3140435.1 hypothetical protein [Microbispora bryophytorum]TQS02517.1 hypothetical protein FLX07_28520 [Microbispora bryophytorum]GGO27847.1 hypothetical protein GCM10011574_61640 [Microbispora bryophytorum]